MLSVDQTSFRLDVEVRIEPDFDFLSRGVPRLLPARPCHRLPGATLDGHDPPPAGARAACEAAYADHAQPRQRRAHGARAARAPAHQRHQDARAGGFRRLRLQFDRRGPQHAGDDRRRSSPCRAHQCLCSRAATSCMFRKVREDDFDVARLFPKSKSTPGRERRLSQRDRRRFRRMAAAHDPPEILQGTRAAAAAGGARIRRLRASTRPERGGDPRGLRASARMARRTLRRRPAAEPALFRLLPRLCDRRPARAAKPSPM